jgi:hypothetical protein
LLNSAGTAVATGTAGQTPVTHTIPAGAGGTYYARIRADGGANFLGQYLLSVVVADTLPPSVAGVTLPAESTSTPGLLDDFAVTFSEELQATTVNNVANYNLRSAGTDGAFDTIDDVDIPLVLTSTYATGLTVGLRTANGGALPAGIYRFRALPGLLDKYGNPLSPVYTRTFAVDGLSGYALDTEPNGTRPTATLLTLDSSQPDLFGANGRGYLLNSADVDFWSFALQAGDRVQVFGEIPGSPGSSGLHYQLFNPAGGVAAEVYAENTGAFAFPLFTAVDAGTYSLRVAPYH